MFHKITPKSWGASRVWNVPQGTVQVGPEFTNGNQTGGGTYPGLRGSLNSPVTLAVVANQNWQGAGKPIALLAIGFAGQSTVEIIGPNVSGKSFGLSIIAGTTIADQPLLISNASNTTSLAAIQGDGSGQLGASTLTWNAAGDYIITPSSGNALILNQAAASTAIIVKNVAAQPSTIALTSNGNTTAAAFILQQGPASTAIISQTAAANMVFQMASTTVLTINTTFQVAIAAPPTAVVAFTVNGAVNQDAVAILAGVNTAFSDLVHIVGSSATGFSGGLFIEAGTNSSDRAFYARSQSGALNFMKLLGDGSGFIGDGTHGISWAVTTYEVTLQPASGTALLIRSPDNVNAIIVNDTGTLTDGVTGLVVQHNGTNKGQIGTGIATGGSGTALNDFGLVASGGELFAGQNGSNTAVGCIPVTYWIRNNSNLTLTSQTAAQKAMNGSTNGALNLPVGQYEFECFMPLSGMSATSGSFGFALGGSATIAAVWWSIASKLGTAAATPEAVQWTYNLQSNANTALATASTATTGFMLCRGFFVVSVAGTVIPQISLGVAAAATVAAGAYFFCRYQSISSARTGPNFGPWT